MGKVTYVRGHGNTVFVGLRTLLRFLVVLLLLFYIMQCKVREAQKSENYDSRKVQELITQLHLKQRRVLVKYSPVSFL